MTTEVFDPKNPKPELLRIAPHTIMRAIVVAAYVTMPVKR